jgi:hypothetical protein
VAGRGGHSALPAQLSTRDAFLAFLSDRYTEVPELLNLIIKKRLCHFIVKSGKVIVKIGTF